MSGNHAPLVIAAALEVTIGRVAPAVLARIPVDLLKEIEYSVP
jgi:hypothetical protein